MTNIDECTYINICFYACSCIKSSRNLYTCEPLLSKSSFTYFVINLIIQQELTRKYVCIHICIRVCKYFK